MIFFIRASLGHKIFAPDKAIHEKDFSTSEFWKKIDNYIKDDRVDKFEKIKNFYVILKEDDSKVYYFPHPKGIEYLPDQFSRPHVQVLFQPLGVMSFAIEDIKIFGTDCVYEFYRES